MAGSGEYPTAMLKLGGEINMFDGNQLTWNR